MNNLWVDELTSCTALYTLCLKRFGVDFLSWDPQVIIQSIPSDTSEINKDKILAVQGLLTTNQFYSYWEPFEKIARVLNCKDPAFGVLTPLSPEEVCWAITEADMLDEDEEIYSSEVKAYIRVVFEHYSFLRTPECLKKIGVSWDNLDSKDSLQQEIHNNFEENITDFIAKRKARITNELSSIS